MPFFLAFIMFYVFVVVIFVVVAFCYQRCCCRCAASKYCSLGPVSTAGSCGLLVCKYLRLHEIEKDCTSAHVCAFVCTCVVGWCADCFVGRLVGWSVGGFHCLTLSLVLFRDRHKVYGKYVCNIYVCVCRCISSYFLFERFIYFCWHLH